MTKPYQTTAPEAPRPVYNSPESFTAKRMKAFGLWLAAVAVIALGVWLRDVTGWAGALGVSLVVALALTVPGLFLWEYSNRLIARELPRNAQPKAKRAGDVWRIHLKREIPVADRGTVDMDADVIDLPVAPREFTRIVREMKRNGTSRDKRPAGVSQPLWRKIMLALEDMDAATNGGPAGWQLADDLDALLSEIDRW